MRKYTIAILAAALAAVLAAGCAGKDKPDEIERADSAATVLGGEAQTAESASEEEEPSVLHVYSIGEDFVNRVKDYYPGYEPAGEDSGVIDGTQVRWHVYSDVVEYREALDEKLAAQADPGSGDEAENADPEDRVDLFVMDEAYLRDYVESGYTLDVVSEVGLTAEELSDQFPYTQQIATDSAGKLKAVTWHAAPGVFAYRRSIARAVLGTDDPEKVQQAVSSWEAFAETAALAKEEGYYMLSGYDDAYQVYSDNVTSAWVEDGALNVDPHLEDWARQTREFAENGYIHGTEQWSDEWRADHTGDGEVFGFFYSSWGIHYTLQDKAEGITESGEGEEPEDVESASGDYAVCRGPEPCHYGGQWIAAASGCDDIDLVRSVMRTLTCDPQVMKKITQDIREFTNTVSGMTELSETGYKAEVLGGQNPVPVYLEAASMLSQKHVTSYDDDLDLGFRVSMQDYFTGKVSEIDALEIFRKTALSRYEELEDRAGDEEDAQEE